MELLYLPDFGFSSCKRDPHSFKNTVLRCAARSMRCRPIWSSGLRNSTAKALTKDAGAAARHRCRRLLSAKPGSRFCSVSLEFWQKDFPGLDLTVSARAFHRGSPGPEQAARRATLNGEADNDTVNGNDGDNSIDGKTVDDDLYGRADDDIDGAGDA